MQNKINKDKLFNLISKLVTEIKQKNDDNFIIQQRTKKFNNKIIKKFELFKLNNINLVDKFPKKIEFLKNDFKSHDSVGVINQDHLIKKSPIPIKKIDVTGKTSNEIVKILEHDILYFYIKNAKFNDYHTSQLKKKNHTFGSFHKLLMSFFDDINLDIINLNHEQNGKGANTIFMSDILGNILYNHPFSEENIFPNTTILKENFSLRWKDKIINIVISNQIPNDRLIICRIPEELQEPSNYFFTNLVNEKDGKRILMYADKSVGNSKKLIRGIIIN